MGEAYHSHQFFRMQTEAYCDSRIHLMHQLMIQPSHPFTQALFIQRPDLLQQDDRVFGKPVIHG